MFSHDGRTVALRSDDNTQAYNVAMELPATADGRPIKHGLLSYALLEDALSANKADFKPQDKTIFLDEWLECAVADVPKLSANQPRPATESEAETNVRHDRPRLVFLKRELSDPGACGSTDSGNIPHSGTTTIVI